MNDENRQAATPVQRPASVTLRRTALALGGILVLLAAGRWAGGYVPQVAQWISDLGAVGPLAFVAAYAVAVIAFVPGSVLTIAAGAIFGLVEGTIYVFIAATIGACGAFLVSRYVAGSKIERRIQSDPRFAAIDRAVAKQGRKIVFLLRLSPVFPFSLLNYALGLTRVRLIDYAIACIGMLPGTVLYVYYGKLAGDVASVVGGAAAPRGAGYYTVLTVGLVATVAVTALVTRTARRALEEVSDV